MRSQNITCSVLKSIWSCMKDEAKSLTGQKSEFAFCLLEAGGGGSCWAQLSNVPPLLFYQQSFSGSAVVVLKQEGTMFTPWFAQPLTLQAFPFLPCVLAHPQTVVWYPFRHFSPPARSCLFSYANHQISLILLLCLYPALQGARGAVDSLWQPLIFLLKHSSCCPLVWPALVTVFEQFVFNAHPNTVILFSAATHPML